MVSGAPTIMSASRRTDLDRLRYAFYTRMRYYAARVLMGLSAADAKAYCGGLSRRELTASANRSVRKRYAHLRASGLSHWETQTIIRGRNDRENMKAYLTKYRAKWGGTPTPGSKAWLRREIARTPWA